MLYQFDILGLYFLPPLSMVDTSSIRDSKPYKGMSHYTACSIAEGFCDGEPTQEELAAAWQYLHDTGLAYQLQGFYGRTASDLIESGLILA